MGKNMSEDTAELKKELDALTARIAKADVVLEEVMTRSNEELKRLCVDEMLAEPAKYLANICVELDTRYPVGITQTLDWMLDNYFEMEFERRVRGWIAEIHGALKNGNHTGKNSIELFKGHAFYVPHDKKTIFVHDGGDEPWQYLVIEDELGSVFVRKIWKRLGYKFGFLDQPTLAYYRKEDFVPVYGDCRDNGHVFTIRPLEGVGYVIWDIGIPMRWFMAMNSTWTELVNVEEYRGLSEPESVENYYKKVA